MDASALPQLPPFQKSAATDVAEIMRTLRLAKWVAIVALAIAVVALAGSVYASFFRTRFPMLETDHLAVTASSKFSEAILVTFPGATASYTTSMAGINVQMPASQGGNSQQAGVHVQGGQVGVLASGQVGSAATFAPGADAVGVQFEGSNKAALPTDNLMHNGNTILSL